MTKKPIKPTKSESDAGKVLRDPKSSKLDKELAAKVLSDKANKKRK